MSTAARAWRAMPMARERGGRGEAIPQGAGRDPVRADEQPREARRPAARPGLQHHRAGGLGHWCRLADADAAGLVFESTSRVSAAPSTSSRSRPGREDRSPGRP